MLHFLGIQTESKKVLEEKDARSRSVSVFYLYTLDSQLWLHELTQWVLERRGKLARNFKKEHIEENMQRIAEMDIYSFVKKCVENSSLQTVKNDNVCRMKKKKNLGVISRWCVPARWSSHK